MKILNRKYRIGYPVFFYWGMNIQKEILWIRINLN